MNELTLAYILLADNQIEHALKIVTGCEAAIRSAGITGWVIRGLALKALCNQAMQNTEQALNALQQALSLAQPEGYCRTFIDHGPPMQQLLQQAARHGILPAYVAQLLSIFSDSQEDKPTVNRSSVIENPIEPLNEREQSILRLMAAGLSNREIAEELYLSVNTIKWYSTHIYSKLGVNSRTKAVARAQEAGIL